MKKILLSVAALASLAAAVPAMAQPYGDYNRGYDNGYQHYGYDRGYNDRAFNIDARQRQLAMLIDRGRRDGSISWIEARQLRNELARIEYLEQRYRVNGLNGWERADLDRRLDRLALQIRAERRDGDRDGRWGDRDGRWDNRY